MTRNNMIIWRLYALNSCPFRQEDEPRVVQHWGRQGRRGFQQQNDQELNQEMKEHPEFQACLQEHDSWSSFGEENGNNDFGNARRQ